jgi:3-phosphoshikimate 1-carboxyvinyltransferase
LKLRVKPGKVGGSIAIPGSKSHTIRGLLAGTLADGKCTLERPLRASDTESCVDICRALGAQVDSRSDDRWVVHGTAGRPRAAADVIDVGNSGTSLFLAMGLAALADGETVFTGDEQIRRRPGGPLIAALNELGATARAEGPNGCAPFVIEGRLRGGRATMECPISQYISSLSLSCPLAEGDTVVEVPLLNEKPYAGMTLGWLEKLGIRYSADDTLSHFEFPGGQAYHAFSLLIPADFSSATFFMLAAAITGSTLTLQGLDMTDTQGDKAVVSMFERMGCTVEVRPDGLSIAGPERLQGATFDLNATPDALPSLAVAGCLAEGETRLLNVPQARAKETDRLDVMNRELSKMGGVVEELEDGLVVRGTGALRGAEVSGWKDHRIVMALAVAGLAADGPTTVDTAETAAITFPNFADLMRQTGADIEELA